MSLNHLILAALLAANPPATKTETPPKDGQCTPSTHEDAELAATEEAAQAAVEADAAKEAVAVAPPPQSGEEKAMRAYLPRLTQALSKGGSRQRAMGLSLSIILSEDRDQKDGHEALLRKEADAAMGDALVQMIAAGIAGDGCKLEAECTRVKESPARLEPDNGLAWIAAISWGGEGTVELMERAGATTRFDDHYIEGFDAMLPLVRSQPPPAEMFNRAAHPDDPPLSREATIFAGAVAFGSMSTIPAVMSTGLSCMTFAGHELPLPQLQACARVGRGMMRYGTSLLTQAAGHELIGESLRTPEDESAFRRIQWRRHAEEAQLAKMKSWSDIERFSADLHATGSESRAMELFMQRNGIPLEPPADWVPNKDDE